MSLWTVLVTGLFAGGASCAAVQGGLLAGAVARQRKTEVEVATARARSKSKKRRPSPEPSRLADDAVPVGGFLLGKLVSHTILGALLGLVGDAVQIGFRARAAMQIGAGLVMIVLAADLLGVRAVRQLIPRPPATWGRLVRRSARWGGGMAPAMLGVATILIPCGITLGMELLAVTSGSAFAGAAIMATFVLGTSPLFAAIGYAARRAAGALGGRLAVLAAVAVLVSGLVSLNAGLRLAGSAVTVSSVLGQLTGMGGRGPSGPAVAAPVDPTGAQTVFIAVHNSGYEPSRVSARAGIPTTLVLRTNGTQGCTRAIVFPSLGIQKFLPPTGDTQVDLGELSAGTHRYTCSMGMYSGEIKVT